MVDVLSDFASSYDDFGADAYINGAPDAVRVMIDEDIEIPDSASLVVRALVTTVIARLDAVVLNGTSYKVMKVSPYGDQREENFISLVEE